VAAARAAARPRVAPRAAMPPVCVCRAQGGARLRPPRAHARRAAAATRHAARTRAAADDADAPPPADAAADAAAAPPEPSARDNSLAARMAAAKRHGAAHEKYHPACATLTDRLSRAPRSYKTQQQALGQTMIVRAAATSETNTGLRPEARARAHAQAHTHKCATRKRHKAPPHATHFSFPPPLHARALVCAPDGDVPAGAPSDGS
jgi:hypothetical protein